MMRLRSFLIIFFIVIWAGVFAQDIHYVQFLSSPLNMNPANAGRFEGDVRYVGNQRSQWRSVTVPYQTFSSSLDARFNNSLIENNKLGIGLLFNADKAGDSEFGTTQIKISGATHHSLHEILPLEISLGLDITYNQNTINYNNLYFGTQYNGNRYVPDLPNEENFTGDHLAYFDYTAGISATYLIRNMYPVNAGVFLTHLNQPDKSFYNDAITELDRRFNIQLSGSLPLSDGVAFIPACLYMNQGKFRELLAGGLLKFRVDHPNFHTIYFGGWYRIEDALILNIQADYKKVSVGFSYDFNISGLQVASHGRGGPEISLIYIFERPRKIDLPDTRYCPTFL